jgi:hypothetical protein
VRVYRNKPFTRFAKANRIADEDLANAIRRVMKGLIDANLGSGLIKQRIARKGEGKSGGFRSILLFKKADRAVFLHGFAKKDVENINPRELKALQKLAESYSALTESQLTKLVALEDFVEVHFDA